MSVMYVFSTALSVTLIISWCKGSSNCASAKKCICQVLKFLAKQLDVSKLHDPNIYRTVRDKLDRLDFEGTWDQFKEQVYSVGLESFRLQQKKILRLV